ncbi:MAG: isocitrate lyase/phosphoenolpyruvate mutase family protein [Ferruginibacter sp.]
MTNYERFRSLHHAEELLVLPNAWDAKSASHIEAQQFPAVATSSMAVAHSLGFEDGQQMSFEDYLFVIRRIVSTVHVPVSVDMEMGYGDSNEAIFQNMLRLAALGVAGINIEDSVIDGKARKLQEVKKFASTIEYTRNKLLAANANLFINLRCDTYILNVENKQAETASRLKIYNDCGADGIFLPCIVNEEDIAAAVAATTLPLNVMFMTGLPGFAELKKLGVKRISMGPFLFNKVYSHIAPLLQSVTDNKNTAPLLS